MKKSALTLVGLTVLVVLVSLAVVAEVQTPSCQTALLVIDIQSAWLDGGSLTTDGVLVQTKTAELATAARAGGVPVVFVIDVSGQGYYSDAELEVAFPHEVQAQDHVVEKLFSNGFRETTLGELLRGIGVTTVLITGYASQGCVNATISGARSEGFEIIIIEDAHSGGGHGDRAAAKNGLWRRLGFNVTPSSEIDFATLCPQPDSEETE